jgi:hypothetical protein
MKTLIRALIIAASFFLAAFAHAASYQFKLIADSSGTFSGVGVAAINASGTVTFRATVTSDIDRAIYTGNGGTLNLIADSSESSPFFRLSSDGPRINAGGTVVFAGILDSGDWGLFTGNGGPVTPVITEDTSDLRSFGDFSINDNGTIAFQANKPTSTGSFNGVYTITNGTVTTIADTLGSISGFDGPEPVVIDANGTVAFVASLDAGGEAIFSGTGGPLTTVVDTSGPFDDFRAGIGINTAGTLSFAADVDAGGRGVFIVDEGVITPIVDPADDTYSFIDGRTSINADELVVFGANLASGEDGLFLAANGSIDTIILGGQMLDGKVVEQVSTLNHQAINDRGELAFWASFTDGSWGVYVAFLAGVDVSQIPDISGLPDISADAVPDIAYLRPGGRPRLRYYSGANRKKFAQVAYLSRAWAGVAAATVADGNQDGVADDPAVAVLGRRLSNDRLSVQVRTAAGGVELARINFLNNRWTAVDVVVIDDANGDGVTDDTAIGVLGFNPARPSQKKTTLQVRRLSDGSLVREVYYNNENWTPLAAGAVQRTGQSPLLAVLAEKNSSKALRVQARVFSDGSLQRNKTFLSTQWRGRDLAILKDTNGDSVFNDASYMVLAVNPGNGLNRVQVRSTGGALVKNVAVLNAQWRARRITGSDDISGNLFEEIGVLGNRVSDGKARLELTDFDTEAITGNIFP